MKFRILTAVLLTAASVLPSAAARMHRDTVRISEFGLAPDTYENATPKIKAALQACRELRARVLLFEPGRYDIWPEGAERREWFISNTSSETECPSKIKTVGVLVENMQGLTLDGCDAELVFHGQMITIAVAHSSDITLRNFVVDFERPAMSEMTVESCDEHGTTVRFHPDSRFDIDGDGRIVLAGEGWRCNTFYCTEFDPDTDRVAFTGGWDVMRSCRAERLDGGRVHFATPADFRVAEGHTLVVRDYIRDHVGMFFYESSDIAMSDMRIRYLNGLGIVGQFTRNITIRNTDCMPAEGSGRIMAASADFMHFSGCSGKVDIRDCRFSGSQDDPINVHGTNLRIMESRGRKVRLRFMHHQSYGFKAFSVRDSVAFVSAATMERIGGAVVRGIKRLSDREVELTLDRKAPEGLVLDSDCLENITCTPEVEIRGCLFTHTHTRGTLVTTPRRVVIADNVYCRTGMSAILIEGDAEGWYESGPVCDVTVENNTFIECGYVGGPANSVIALHPSNRTVDASRPVHRNVKIRNNRFVTFGNPVLYAKSTGGLTFENNEVTAEGYSSDNGVRMPFILEGCSDVRASGNKIEGYGEFNCSDFAF